MLKKILMLQNSTLDKNTNKKILIAQNILMVQTSINGSKRYKWLKKNELKKNVLSYIVLERYKKNWHLVFQ